jgi:hypothetical protein
MRSTLVSVRVVVTEIAWDGSIRRRALDTCGLRSPQVNQPGVL